MIDTIAFFVYFSSPTLRAWYQQEKTTVMPFLTCDILFLETFASFYSVVGDSLRCIPYPFSDSLLPRFFKASSPFLAFDALAASSSFSLVRAAQHILHARNPSIRKRVLPDLLLGG